ncbi:MAG: hypoxanthine phosphoribosyltransferase, partial [Pseudomonadota bacterium]
SDIRIATIFYRETEQTLRPPDFYVHETQDWLVLPYELTGLTREDLETNKPELANILKTVKTPLPHFDP